jgi:hypothetical protein
MKRATKMLRDAHCDYGLAPLHALLCGVRLDEDDITAVDAALRDGALNKRRIGAHR